MTKENWVILLCAGLILMILAAPFGGRKKEGAGEMETPGQEAAEKAITEGEGAGEAAAAAYPYEAFLEQRIKEVLSQVEGVGEVDVLIVLKSSEQKVYQTDGRSRQSSTREQDASGGVRDVTEQELENSTVVINGTNSGNSGTEPLLEKELRPEISGIVISAQGGGSPSVKTEIIQAMEALFGLPAHKIKVLKRVE